MMRHHQSSVEALHTNEATEAINIAKANRDISVVIFAGPLITKKETEAFRESVSVLIKAREILDIRKTLFVSAIGCVPTHRELMANGCTLGLRRCDLPNWLDIWTSDIVR